MSQHISAASLRYLDTPTLLNMINLCSQDKSFWKSAYDEEFYGFQDLPAWNVINKHEYQRLHTLVGEALPSMAISTIKYDENRNPKTVKWIIVALGNLNPHK